MIRRPSGIAATAHYARIYKAGNQAITAFADTPLTFGTVEARTGTYLDTSVADRVTTTAPGLYLVTFECWFAGGTAGERTVSVRNGTVSIREGTIGSAGRALGADVVRLAAGAQIGLNVYVGVSTVTVTGSAAKDVGLALTYLSP
jgi:hypothetical protein